MAKVWHKALPSDQLAAGRLTKVHVAGRAVLLARLEDGTPVAASVVCPHEQADLSDGSVFMGAVDCPRHHYLYDLRTGENRYPRNVFPPDLAANLVPLPLYPVRESEGWLWVAQDA
jgi:nitrite reductase/ring-hydroxylating ferredoxin subunit